MAGTDGEQLIRRAYAALAEGDWDAMVACAHPQIELNTVAAGSFSGPEGVRAWVEVMAEAWQSWTFDLDLVERAGDERFLVSGVLSGHSRIGSVTTSQRFWVLWELADGAMRRGTHFIDEPPARRAAAER